MRHANDQDLDRLEELLLKLRQLSQLRERKRGYFSRGSRAFLHFHEDAGDLYVDVKFDSAFQRMRITSDAEQVEFLARVRTALSDDHERLIRVRRSGRSSAMSNGTSPTL